MISIFHLKCSSISSLSVLIVSATYDDEVKLVTEKDAGVVNIEKLQARVERVRVVFPDKTFPGM